MQLFIAMLVTIVINKLKKIPVRCRIFLFKQFFHF